MTKDKALDMALAALEFDGFMPEDLIHRSLHAKAINAIKQALAAPVQEPVAWMDKYGEIYKDVPEVLSTDKPLYTTPPATQPAQPAQPANLASVVQAHIKDLRACLPTLLAYEMAQTAAEVEKAADELGAALNTPLAAKNQFVGLTDEEWQDLSDRYGMILFGRFKNEIETKLREKNTP
jgi:hypothetical protein